MKKIFKKIFIFGMVLLLGIGCVSCGGSEDSNSEKEKSPKEVVEQRLKGYIQIQVMLEYGIQKPIDMTIGQCYEEKENQYKVSGKVKVIDKYADSYTGHFDAIVIYDPETKDIDVKEFDLETPTKDK